MRGITASSEFLPFNFPNSLDSRHRHPTEHACEHIPDADDKTQDPEIRERLRKMHEALDPIVKEEREAAGQQGAPEVKTEKVGPLSFKPVF